VVVVSATGNPILFFASQKSRRGLLIRGPVDLKFILRTRFAERVNLPYNPAALALNVYFKK
jgi:hypothetical protein